MNVINEFLQKLIEELFDFRLWWDKDNIGINFLYESFKNIPYSICEPKDFTEKVFWEQIKYARNRYNQSKDRLYAFRSIVEFYKYLIYDYPDFHLFENCKTIYPNLITNKSFVEKWIKNGYRFIVFATGVKYNGNDNIIFIVRGMDRLSSRLKSVDYIHINLSNIKSSLYRELVFKYVTSTASRLINYSPTLFSKTLNFITELKKSNNYSNGAELYLSCHEASLVLDYIRSCYNASTRRHFIGTFRAFVSWCCSEKYLSVEESFFTELVVHIYQKQKSSIGNIDDETTDILLKASKKKVEENPERYLAFDSVLRLMMQTNIRISSICSLKKNCITQNIKPGKYTITYVTKTSNGDNTDSTTITAADKTILDKMIELAEERLYPEVTFPMNEMIFLYRSLKSKRTIRVVDKFSFRLFLHSLGKADDSVKYSALNLRKTYMTHAKDHVIRNKKSDAEYKALTKHSQTSITDKHYVKLNIEEYFETLYEVETDKVVVKVENNVTRNVPHNTETVGDRTHKCGVCRVSHCQLLNALPCFVCQYFITSPEFLPVFKQMVEDINKRVIKASVPHDKEDLISVKEVLVKYIIELENLQR